jgi:hypothetical protein
MSEVELSRITIRRFLTDQGGDLVEVNTDNGDGGRIPVIEALGLLQLAVYDVCNAPADDEGESDAL